MTRRGGGGVPPMPSASQPPVRGVFVPVFVLGALLATAVPVSAQGFGLGGRLAWVSQDVDVDADAVRFYGLHMRAIGGRLGVELSFDRHTESFEAVNEKVIETPIQASILVRLAQRSFAPYLLGGPGWYRRTVEPIDGPDDSGDSTTKFGWHAGGGLEILAGRHFGIHGDYRYTFLDFGGDDDEDEGFIGGLLPGTRGRCGRSGRPSTSEAGFQFLVSRHDSVPSDPGFFYPLSPFGRLLHIPM